MMHDHAAIGVVVGCAACATDQARYLSREQARAALRTEYEASGYARGWRKGTISPALTTGAAVNWPAMLSPCGRWAIHKLNGDPESEVSVLTHVATGRNAGLGFGDLKGPDLRALAWRFNREVPELAAATDEKSSRAAAQRMGLALYQAIKSRGPFAVVVS
jgi:hypothetical protein